MKKNPSEIPPPGYVDEFEKWRPKKAGEMGQQMEDSALGSLVPFLSGLGAGARHDRFDAWSMQRAEKTALPVLSSTGASRSVLSPCTQQSIKGPGAVGGCGGCGGCGSRYVGCCGSGTGAAGITHDERMNSGRLMNESVLRRPLEYLLAADDGRRATLSVRRGALPPYEIDAGMAGVVGNVPSGTSPEYGGLSRIYVPPPPPFPGRTLADLRERLMRPLIPTTGVGILLGRIECDNIRDSIGALLAEIFSRQDVPGILMNLAGRNALIRGRFFLYDQACNRPLGLKLAIFSALADDDDGGGPCEARELATYPQARTLCDRLTPLRTAYDDYRAGRIMGNGARVLQELNDRACAYLRDSILYLIGTACDFLLSIVRPFLTRLRALLDRARRLYVVGEADCLRHTVGTTLRFPWEGRDYLFPVPSLIGDLECSVPVGLSESSPLGRTIFEYYRAQAML